jgi:hypothetical protein
MTYSNTIEQQNTLSFMPVGREDDVSTARQDQPLVLENTFLGASDGGLVCSIGNEKSWRTTMPGGIARLRW